MHSQEERARLVKAVSAFVEDTALAPSPYERYLLHRFVVGELTIYQVLEVLAVYEEATQLLEAGHLPRRVLTTPTSYPLPSVRPEIAAR